MQSVRKTKVERRSVIMVMMMVMVTIKMMVTSMRFRRMITMTRRPFD